MGIPLYHNNLVHETGSSTDSACSICIRAAIKGQYLRVVGRDRTCIKTRGFTTRYVDLLSILPRFVSDYVS